MSPNTDAYDIDHSDSTRPGVNAVRSRPAPRVGAGHPRASARQCSAARGTHLCHLTPEGTLSHLIKTDKGVIMVTSLANFRSDYTVVHIPDGDFLAHREQLYVNINLLRMGCGGRSALTLQPPRSVRLSLSPTPLLVLNAELVCTVIQRKTAS